MEKLGLITNLAKPYDFYKKLDVKENSKLTIEASHTLNIVEINIFKKL